MKSSSRFWWMGGAVVLGMAGLWLLREEDAPQRLDPLESEGGLSAPAPSAPLARVEGDASARAEGGETQQIQLRLRLHAPRLVSVGVPFEVKAVVTNVGSEDLSQVVVQARGGDAVLPALSEEGQKRDIKSVTYASLPAGASETHVFRFRTTVEGESSVKATTRDAPGWAAAGAEVLVLAAVPESYVASEVQAEARAMAMELQAELLDEVVVGEAFRVRFSVRNQGSVPLEGVVIAWRGTDSIGLAGSERFEYQRLGVGASESVVASFFVSTRSDKKPRVTTSSRDRAGWAAAGVILPLQPRGAPEWK